MEAIKFQNCDRCGGEGKLQNKTCPTCFGHGQHYLHNNNLLYWDKPISYSHIFITEFKKTINIIINGLLIVSFIITILYAAYLVYVVYDFDQRALWDFLRTSSQRNLLLWSLITLAMYLYYRLSYVSLNAKDRLVNLKNKDKFTSHNIADSLNIEAAKIIDQAWLYARHKKIFPVTAWHLLYILLDDKDIRLVLARLGVGAQNIKDSIDKSLPEITRNISKEKTLTPFLRQSFLNAYLHMVKRGANAIAEVDLFYGLMVSSQSVKNYFYDMDIDEEKIENVITWVNINKELAARYKRFRSRAFFKPKSGINRSYTAIATPLLDSFSTDLTRMAKNGYLPLSVAREIEISEMVATVESDLMGVVLVGPPGVGKNNIIEGLANRMMAEEVSDFFQDKRLVSISIPALVSGATGTGVIEERFLAMLNEAAMSGNIILFIDNIHQLIGVSSQGTEGVDLSAVLASTIRSGNVTVVSTTNNKDYVELIEGTELGQTLKKVNINEPDKNQTIKILESHVGGVEAKNKVHFTYDALDRIYELANRYITDAYLPSKAIDLMEQVAVKVSKSNRQDPLIRATDVDALVSHKTGIPLTSVTSKESIKLLNLEDEIHQRIIGQDEAVRLVSSALRRARAELRDKKRPIVNLLFLGPTGVGKTELAKTVAQTYFGDENNMIRLDMSEYQAQNSLPRLIGSPQSGTPGLLTEAVRHKPFALLLLDEIEKANKDILNVFLQVMEDGRLTDALGRTVDFTNLILVATSNAGTSFIQDQIHTGRGIEEFKDQLIKEEIRSIFSPEFINRFDGTVVFKPLNQEEIYLIAGLLLKKVAKRLEEKGIFFEVTEAAQRELAEAGFDPVFGARPLRRVIQERVDDALANFLLTGKLGRRDVVVYDVGGKITVKRPTGY